MNRKIFFAIILIFFCSFFVFDAIGAGKFFRIKGFFDPEPTWTGGHPGKILFDIGVTNSGSTAGIDTAGYLSGSFWLGTVGWVNFAHGVSGVDRAQILCTDEVLRNPGLVCPATGYAWSQNAGWIMLSGATIDGGSGVYYDPASGLVKGFGHTHALGWIPFFAKANDVVIAGPVTTATQTGISLDGIGLNFIGKIAVIGSIAGSRIYDLPNQQVGYIFSGINHADILNTIKKNISLITRNVSAVELADDYSSRNFVVKTGDYSIGGIGSVWPSGKDTIIVSGGDIILDQTTPTSYIGDSTTTYPRALIVLRDAAGNGGNIIITENVKRIYAFIYAEGVIYSGVKTAGVIKPYTDVTQGGGALSIPAEQLYVKGAIISKNTIGGALQDPSICPVVIAECTPTTAQIYDLNYFRTYDATDPTQKSIPYSDPRLNSASFIIEYDPRLASDPPPGLASVLQ